MRSTTLLCLAVLLLTAPAASRAQESTESPASPPPVVRAPDEPLPGRSARLLPEAETEPGYARPARIVTGTLVGTLGAALGGVAGMLAGTPLSSCFFDGCSPQRAPAPYLGYMVGSALAGSATYYGIGGFIYGRGRFLPTLLGATVPQVLLGIPVFAGALDEGYLLLSPLLAALGAAIGYELTHGSGGEPLTSDEPDPFARRPDSSGVHVVPVLGARTGGGVLGLAGTF